MGYLRDFWGKMGLIKLYGIFSNFFGINGCNHNFWRIIEHVKGGELVQTKRVLFAQLFLSATANLYVSPEINTPATPTRSGKLRNMARGG